MFEIIPVRKEDFDLVMAQDINENAKSEFTPDVIEKIIDSKRFVSVLVNGVVTVCGGVWPIWDGRGYLWCMFNKECKTNFVPVFRGIQKHLDDEKKVYRRIEVAIPIGFEHTFQRSRLLGFELECLAPKYLPNGKDCYLFTWLKKDKVS